MSTAATVAERAMAKTQAGAGLGLENAVCMRLRLRTYGVRRRVDAEGLLSEDELKEKEVDPKVLRVQKEILTSTTLDEIGSTLRAAKAFVRSQSIPAAFLRGGIYMIRLERVTEVDERLDAYRKQLDGQVAEFVEAYPRMIEAAKARLGTQWSADDYMPASEVAKAFGLESTYLQFESPTNLQRVNQAIFKREAEKAAKLMKRIVRDAELALWTELKAMIDHLAERLTVSNGEKPKVLVKGTIEKLTAFLDVMPFRNLETSPETRSLIASLRGALSGLDEKAIRGSASVRDFVSTSVSAAKLTLDTLVVKAGRSVDLE